MIILPTGEFNMGSNNGEGDEKPVHHVTIRKLFAMGKTEITQGQWRALMSTTSVQQNSGENGLGELVGKIKHILPNHKRKDVTEGHFNAIMETSPEYYKNCGDHCTEEQKRAIREDAENNPSYFKNCGDECPVEQVSWADAQKYIQKLNAKTGKQYRLPSEAEWEYACRGGTQNEYCGSDNVDAVAWYGAYSNPQGNSGRSTHAVATLSANGFGLFDMSGNVWEWVEDAYHAGYSGAPTDGSNWVGDAVRHTLRGGAWSSKPQEVRATQRSRNEPSSRGSVGFRVVRVLP
jgi:formylglycine-generating enzyme required for sulfatase activity